MSASPRPALRLLTASTTLVLAAGLFSAAHADQADDSPRPTTVAADEHLSLPVQVAPPLAPAVVDDTTTPPAATASVAEEPAPPATPTAAEVDAVRASTPPAPTSPVSPAPGAPAPTPPAPRAAAPAPAPAARHDPPPAQPPAAEPTESDAQRIERAYAAAVPGAWRGAIAASFEVIPGSTSWASSTGRISIAEDHLASFDLLVDVIAHEFGHLIAFRYGTQAYAGAPPAGWPAPAVRPEEAWADCVQRAFLGRSNPSHGLPPCEGEQLRAAQDWLAPGPGARTRTG